MTDDEIESVRDPEIALALRSLHDWKPSREWPNGAEYRCARCGSCWTVGYFGFDVATVGAEPRKECR